MISIASAYRAKLEGVLLVAQVLRIGARELEEFVEASAAWDPLTRRRKLNAVVPAVLENVVDAETASNPRVLDFATARAPDTPLGVGSSGRRASRSRPRAPAPRWQAQGFLRRHTDRPPPPPSEGAPFVPAAGRR